jgi:hypothetical protein
MGMIPANLRPMSHSLQRVLGRWFASRSISLLPALLGFGLAAQADQAIYTDALLNSWVSYGWATTIIYNNASPVHAGSKSVAITIGSGWQAIYIHHSPFNSTPYTHFTFWINGGSAGGQKLQVQGLLNQEAQTAVALQPLPANSWRQITLSLAELGVAGRSNLDGFWIQDTTGGAQPVFFVDDISLVTLPTVTLTAPLNGASFTAPATINLAANVSSNGHSISKVQFYRGTTLLGEATSAPYTSSWSGVGPGSYAVFSRASYDAGSTVDSPAATVVIATNSPVTIGIDVQGNQRPISPLIYGVAFASSNQLADLNAPLNRSGGNSETRYNWLLNAHSTANDWYFESRADSSATPAGSADDLVSRSKAAGAEPMLSIPMIEWAPKLGTNRAALPSFSVAKYGAQKAVDPYWSDAGNGISAATSAYVTNDPNDANFQTNSSFQAAFVQHLTNRWGLSANGGVRYYLLDNEHTIWHSTHRDVHPVGATMQEIRNKMFEYSAMVKGRDPSALVLGPEEWGWSGYFYSGLDQQWSGARSDWNPAHFPDRGTNGGWDYVPWLLDQYRRRDTNANQRLLDYCTVHIYPQNGEFGDDVSASMQLMRNRSTRALWDTSYVDPSWIKSVIKLIPRLKGWVAQYYPGTKTGITEYNWGAEGHINGATAQADIYGIFGREGLDLAARWTTPDESTPTYKAMKLFRNYDGRDSGFGDTSVSASGPNPDSVSIFAAKRSSDGALTLMVVNKEQWANAFATIGVTNFSLAGTGQIWQVSAINAISRLADLSFTGSVFSNTFPPQSVTLLILPAAAAPPPPQLRAGAVDSGNTFDFWLDGQPGRTYRIQSSTDLVNWVSVLTHALSSNSWHVLLPATNAPAGFYRGVWVP